MLLRKAAFKIHKIASPKYCYQLLKLIQPWVVAIFFLLLIYGLLSGLVISPPDYQQGNAFRIIYIHVPLAIWSLGIYAVMSLAALSFLVWHIKLADMVAKSSAIIGAFFTLLTLITGSLWGEPTWGTWWIWDARLTSEAILLFSYVAVIVIRAAMPEARLGARASAVVTLIGVVNLPIVHYSVDWWHTLHQGATILKWGLPSIASVMLYPLLAMIAAGGFYYLWWLIIRLSGEILLSEHQAQWVKKLK